MLWQIIITSIAFALFGWLSHPVELRQLRWLRIILSLLIVWMITGMAMHELNGGMIGGIALFVLLVFIWSGHISHRMAGRLVGWLYGTRFGGGFRPDFGAARSRAQDGDLPTAMAMVQEELEKDPLNYEGLMLLASAHLHLQEPDRALMQVEAILQNPLATVDQKRYANSMKEECLQFKLRRQRMAG